MHVAHHTDFGQTIREYRNRAGYKQAELGERLGCSASTVSRLESGGAQHADVGTLQQIADVLRIPPEKLGLAARSAHGTAHPAGMVGPTTRGEDMRRRTLLGGALGLTATGALVGPRLMAAVLHPTGDLPAAETAAQLRRVRTAFAAGRYGDAAQLLPPVISTAQHAPRLTAALVHGYALASEIAVKTNENDLASVAADRALAVAHRDGDPVLVAIAAQRVAIALRRDDHPADALTLLTSAIDALTHPDARSLRGRMLLTASYTAAVAGDDAVALAMLTDAEHLTRHAPASARFSAPITSGYAISIHTVLGDTARALDYATRLQPGQLPTPERTARTAVDAAHTWDMHGHPQRAVASLLAAERAAPEELRRASVRRRLIAMLDRPGPVHAGLRQLAVRAGALS